MLLHHLFLSVIVAFGGVAKADGDRVEPYGRGTGLSKEVVLGVELTMTGAVSAVSLPDGRLVEAAAVKGDKAFVSLMRNWFEICTSNTTTLEQKKARVDSKYPQQPQEELYALQRGWEAWLRDSQQSWVNGWRDWLGWKPRDIDGLYAQTYFQGDHAMHSLQSVFSDLHGATAKAMTEITPFAMPEMPYVEIAVPGWLFRNIPAFLDMDDGPVSLNFTDLLSLDYLAITRRISVAAHRAGFRRSVFDNPMEVMHYHAKGAHVYGPRPAPSMSIRSAVDGICDVSRGVRTGCKLLSTQTCDPREIFAVIDHQSELDASFVVLWLQECKSHHPSIARWMGWEYSTAVPDYGKEQKLMLTEMAVEIQKASSGRSGFDKVDVDGQISVLITGDVWLDNQLLADFLSSSELDTLPLSVVRGEGDPFLAAISAAEVARYEWFSYHAPHLEEDYYQNAVVEVGAQAEREL